MELVDYKDTAYLRRFMSERGKIKSRANTGTCVQHQSDIAVAIKTAREMALLPYAVRTAMGNKGGGRRGRDAGPGGRPSGRPSGPPADRPAAVGEAVDDAAAAAPVALDDDVLTPESAAPELAAAAASDESAD
jgi:ribosomal protein S18